MVNEAALKMPLDFFGNLNHTKGSKELEVGWIKLSVS